MNHDSAALPQLNSLAKIYQGIERITCRADRDRIGEDIEDILAAIWGNPAEGDEGASNRLPWPKIHTIAVDDMRKPVDPSALRNIIDKLMELAAPSIRFYYLKFMLPTGSWRSV
ncbi:hypothetical protein FIBSPDRAFT_868072 [Athelia psychrophila]|uniref:Uncharacterized protein n=1 Tax=Athelia psychrophila TaxID=1759441 RepID=A0A166DGS2_9AGAM|nr:hypothetical protein FIBSPDRAFT_868072 [Fibularhizoctonia sp. CBS 109695]